MVNRDRPHPRAGDIADLGPLPERIALESRMTVPLLKDVNAALHCREMIEAPHHHAEPLVFVATAFASGQVDHHLIAAHRDYIPHDHPNHDCTNEDIGRRNPVAMQERIELGAD